MGILLEVVIVFSMIAFIIGFPVYTVNAMVSWEERRNKYLRNANRVLQEFLVELIAEYQRLPLGISPDTDALSNEIKRLRFSLPRADENPRWRAWDVWHWRRLRSRDPKTWNRVRKFDKTGFIS